MITLILSRDKQQRCHQSKKRIEVKMRNRQAELRILTLAT
jgi:hypothetical protein